MAKNKTKFSFRSTGDFEVAVLHENQSIFPDIINPDLYDVLGTPPDQSVQFHNSSCFDYYLIRVVEVFSEGRAILDDGKKQDFSLFTSIQWFCQKYPQEALTAGLDEACKNLNAWLSAKKPFSFWCGEIGIQFSLELSRQDLIKFAANICKHHLLRLDQLLKKLDTLLNKHGYSVKEQELIAILNPFTQELRSRLLYHASYLTELLYEYFAAINRVIIKRFENNPTNRVRHLHHPVGVSEDSIMNLYGDTLVFMRYDEDRFSQFKPTTGIWLRKRY